MVRTLPSLDVSCTHLRLGRGTSLSMTPQRYSRRYVTSSSLVSSICQEIEEKH